MAKLAMGPNAHARQFVSTNCCYFAFMTLKKATTRRNISIGVPFDLSTDTGSGARSRSVSECGLDS